jgi:DNA-binding transcriptional MerR regulator
MRTLEDDALRISEAARRLGVSAQYLRLLETEGKIPAARRVFGCRVYSNDDVVLLRAVGVGSGQRLRAFTEVFDA